MVLVADVRIISVVIFGLRAEEARVPAKRTSNNLTIYMQTTLSIGYISIAADLLLLLRCLTTAATLSAARTVNMFTRSPEPGLKPLSSVGSTFPTTAQDIIDERAKERKGYRDINGLLQLLYWIPFALGTVAGIMYIKAETDASKAQLVQQLRYVTYFPNPRRCADCCTVQICHWCNIVLDGNLGADLCVLRCDINPWDQTQTHMAHF